MRKDPCCSANVRVRSTQLLKVATVQLDNRVPIPLFINGRNFLCPRQNGTSRRQRVRVLHVSRWFNGHETVSPVAKFVMQHVHIYFAGAKLKALRLLNSGMYIFNIRKAFMYNVIYIYIYTHTIHKRGQRCVPESHYEEKALIQEVTKYSISLSQDALWQRLPWHYEWGKTCNMKFMWPTLWYRLLKHKFRISFLKPLAHELLDRLIWLHRSKQTQSKCCFSNCWPCRAAACWQNCGLTNVRKRFCTRLLNENPIIQPPSDNTAARATDCPRVTELNHKRRSFAHQLQLTNV